MKRGQVPVRFFKGGYSLNRIRQFSFVVEYVYLAFICILIIKKEQPEGFDFGLYSPLIVNISIALIYSIILYYSGRDTKPSKAEVIFRLLYLYMAAKLMVETQNPSIQIIIALPTVIMALRYSMFYTVLTAFMTTSVILINQGMGKRFEFDYMFIYLSFIWVIGLLVNSSMELERQMQVEKQKLQEREKLAAIGQMAAGIAHEVRNPLTTIKGLVQLLYKYQLMKDKMVMQNYLELIDQEIERVDSLLKDFLQFAKPVKPKLTMHNINRTMEDISILLEAHCMSNNIRIDLILAPDMPNILCDYDQIKQVVVNIVLNSIDAMQGSKVKILKLITEYDQNNVYIKVEDTGSGMTGEQMQKIFNPFYTTKENGTGLGLSVCYSIIENHHGKINVSSQLDKGTEFEIVLPRFN
jgi:signal transduction histidine kinase